MKGKKTIGVGLIVLSGVFWLALPGVAFLSVSNWWKGAIVAALLVLAEIAFWVGSVMVGAALWKRLKNSKAVLWLRKLFRSKAKLDPSASE
ncbi:MAG: transporter suffix domain-containing protein [bacterium]